MGTDTKIAVDHPGMTGATPKPPRDKVVRIATMTKQLLDEVRTHPLIPQALIGCEGSTLISSTSCSPISPPTYAKNCSGSRCRSPATPSCPTLNCASPTPN
jgi:hypothetical protein